MPSFDKSNDVLAELEGLIEHNSRGTDIKASDLQKLVAKYRAEKEEDDKKPKPKTMVAASEAAKRHLAQALRQGNVPTGTEAVKS